MANFAVVENESKIVVNIIVWEGAEWLPPRNHMVIQSDTANIGDIYIPETGTFEKAGEL
jgi:hypothetical protein